MRRLGLAFSVLAVVAAGAADAQPGPAPVTANDQDQAAVMATLSAFAFGCLERASFANSAKEYADGANEIGRQGREQAPQFAVLAFSIEGVNGDTCRVTYRGAHADLLWKSLSDFSKNKLNGDCSEAPATPNRVSIACAANTGNPAYEERIERAGDQVAASLVWRGPKLP